jgi:hypothetical protein
MNTVIEANRFGAVATFVAGTVAFLLGDVQHAMFLYVGSCASWLCDIAQSVRR